MDHGLDYLESLRLVETRMARRSKTQKQRGGSKRRGATRKASSWANAVTKVYKQMKKENPESSLKDAMQRASQLRKQGKL